MQKFVFLFFLIPCFLVSCSNNVKLENNSQDTIKAELSENNNLAELKLEASRLRAGGSIKNVELSGNSAVITYVKDFEEYKSLNPQSGLTKTELENYWENGGEIEKALVDGSVRLMKKLSFIDSVTIVLPFKGVIYSISVNKPDLEKFVGSDFNTIISNWDEKFSTPYVYNDQGRKSFYKKFGTKK